MKVLKCFGIQSNEIMEEDIVLHLNANLSCQDGYWFGEIQTSRNLWKGSFHYG